MRLSLRWALGVLALGLGLACLGGPGDPEPRAEQGEAETRGEPSPEPAADRPRVELPPVAEPTAITEAEIDSLIEVLIPYIEAEAGARFTSVPRGLHGTAEALQEVLISETRTILRRIYDVPDVVIEQMVASTTGEIPGLVGKYASSTGAVYLVPSAFLRLGQAVEERAEVEDMVVVILIHELAHALQDQVADLDAVLDRLEDRDHFDGLRGITEGQANWITREVARALGREAAFWAVSRSQGWGPDGLKEPGAFPIFMLYGQGMFMCDHHAERGGTDKLWEMVRHPPRSTTMLFRPERYAPSLDRATDLRGVFRGLGEVLTRGLTWIPADSHLGEGSLRAAVVGLPEDRVDRVLGSIDWGFERKIYSPGGSSAGPRRAAVQVVHFERPEHATELVELLTDGLQAQADARTRLEADLSTSVGQEAGRTWVVEAVPYDRIQGDAVIRRVVGPLSATGARLSIEEEQSLWVVRGDQLVVLSVSGFRPGNRLDRAVELVFSQLEAAAAQER